MNKQYVAIGAIGGLAVPLVVLAALLLSGCSGKGSAGNSADKEAVEKFLTAYYKTPYADRGKYVLDPEEFEKVQETFYKGKLIPDDLQTVVSSVRAGPRADYLTAVASFNYTMAGKKQAETKETYLVDSKNGLKVDWAANAGYNPVGFKAWAAGTDDTFTLRVEAELSDLYSSQYEGAQKTHYSVSFSGNYGDRHDSFWGYVLKKSELGEKLFEILKDGHTHKLIVTIERTGSESDVVGIKKLVSETWVK